MTYIRAQLFTIYPDGYYNEIDVSGLLGPVPAYDTLLIQRTNYDGSVTIIRNANNIATGGVDEMVITDYEAPLNAGAEYLVTAIRHNGDGSTTQESVYAGTSPGPAVFTDDFESGVGNWTQMSGTLLTSDATSSHTGSKSAKIDPNGSGGTKGITLNSVQPVVATVSYDFIGFVMANVSDPGNINQVSWNITWKDSGGSTISTDSNVAQSNSLAMHNYTTSTWIPIVLTSVAPAGAVNVAVTFTYSNTNNSPLHWLNLDDVTFVPSIIPTAVTLPFDTETVMLKSLVNPSLSMELSLVSMDSPQYPTRQQINPIIGAKFPVVLSDVQGARTGTLTFRTDTPFQRTAFLQLFESGATLLFQANSDYYSGDGFEDMYFLPGSVNEVRPAISSRDPCRTWTVPYTEVASPSGVLTSIPNNSWLLVTSFGTWQNVLDLRTSWLDVLNNPFGD